MKLTEEYLRLFQRLIHENNFPIKDEEVKQILENQEDAEKLKQIKFWHDTKSANHNGTSLYHELDNILTTKEDK